MSAKQKEMIEKLPKKYEIYCGELIMDSNNLFICGTLERVKWYKEELLKNIECCITTEEIKFTVGWYLLEGASNGLKKEWLIESIIDNKELHELAISLTNDDIQRGRKPPLFREGDLVEVTINAKNTTYHKGIIQTVVYHFKNQEWNYYICENGKKVSKRYDSIDLKLIEQ